MKRFFLLFLVLGLTAGISRAEKLLDRAGYTIRIESCEAILREFMAAPATAIPPEVLQRAKALVIVNQFKGGFFIGVKDGYGVVLVRKPDGSWSVPGLLRAGEASLGLQIGASKVESVFVIMDEETPRLLFQNRFNVGVDAKAVMGPRIAEAEAYNRELLNTPVLVYTKQTGLFAGATVKAGHLTRDTQANRLYYNTRYSLPEIIYSDWITPPVEVVPLLNFVQQITQ